MMSMRARIISFLVGLALLGVVSFLVRRRKLYNIYAASWFAMSLIFIALGLFSSFVESLAAALGIYFVPAAILVVAVGALMVIVLHLSMIVTEQHKQIRTFEKELALIKTKAPTLKTLPLLFFTFLLSSCATTGMFSGTGRGLLYTDIKESNLVTAIPTGKKRGTACAQNYLGLISTGDASLSMAMRDGAITQVSSVDVTDTSIFVFWGKHCTVVTGN